MKKKFLRSVLAVICVLALAAGFLPAAFASEEDDVVYVNGETKVFTAEGELSAILRLPVEYPGRIHILTSGVNISLAIYDEETFELFGVYYTENGLIDVPFDAYPGTFLLGFSGWGEVAVLVADEGTAAQLYANAQAAEEWVEEPAEEWVEEAVEEWTEEPAEEPAEEPVEETAEEPSEEAAEEPEEALAEVPAEEPEEVPAEVPAEELEEEPVEEWVEEPAEEPDEEWVEEPVEVPEEAVAETPAEEWVEESVEEPAEEPAWEPEEEPEEPAVEEPAEEPEEELAYYDPSLPIYYEFTGNGTVSVLSILNEVGSPANMVMEVRRETDGFFSAFGSSDGDWLLTPFAYFDNIGVTVKAGYFNAADGSIKEAVYTLVLSYPDPAQPEEPAEEIPEVPAEEPVEEITEEVEVIEEPAENVEEPAEVPAEELAEEVAEEPVEEPAEEVAEEPVEESEEEPEEEPTYYDPSIPIRYEFTGNGTVSVLSILKEVGAPVNMIKGLTRESDGWFFATGSSDGDWLLTPFAYFDSIDVSVTGAFFDSSDGSVTDTIYTLNLSYPDPAAEVKTIVEEPAPITEVTISVERREGNEVRLFAENIGEDENEGYVYQWQYSLDNAEWFDIDGANGSDYTFNLDSTNGRYYWRLIVSETE